MERQSRLVYSEEQKEVLTTFFNEGMTSTKKAMCDKIRACATRVGISEDQVKSREIAKLTADLKELKRSNDELRQKLASNTSRFTAGDQQPDQLLLPAGQATVEMGWGYLRKQLREFTLNTQQDLESERASLMTRCIMAEEQLARLQHYIDTNLKRYQEEIVRLRTLLGNTIPAAHSRR